ncbi:MAG: hypothetical protein LBV12_06515 [Puniceicoccales bacterium]|nr:hypothetical protein [Puniceicoccales bacterium]
MSNDRETLLAQASEAALDLKHHASALSESLDAGDMEAAERRLENMNAALADLLRYCEALRRLANPEEVGRP